MPHILVLYGTTDGHTRKVARAIGDALGAQGAEVDVVEAAATDVDPAPYDGVVVTASVHAGGYQRAVRRWVRRHAPALDGKPGAFVTVCLAVLQHEPAVQQELAAIVDRFLSAARWRPTFTKFVAGALLYTRYNPIKRWVMTRIVRKAGGDTDTSRDYEYTDWADLRAFAEQFGRFVPARRADAEAPAVRGRVA